jgi:hypothetical protein
MSNAKVRARRRRRGRAAWNAAMQTPVTLWIHDEAVSGFRAWLVAEIERRSSSAEDRVAGAA